MLERSEAIRLVNTLGVKPGVEVDRIAIGGEVRTTGDSIVALEIQGEVDTLEKAGEISALGTASDALRVRGEVDGVDKIAFSAPYGDTLARTETRPVDDADALSARLGPIVDSNIHLWDQSLNPVFWLSDRSMLRSMLGPYDSLPDRYVVEDYSQATAGLAVSGAVWSDPGTDDPLAAIEWVREQNKDGLLVGLVTLADPAKTSFASLVDQVRGIDLVTAVRIRLTDRFGDTESASMHGQHVDALIEPLRLLQDAGLVAVIETTANELDVVTTVARELPELRFVVDHFGWPVDLSAAGRRTHLKRLAPLAAQANVATRIDAIGTIFGSWTTESIRPWLEAVVDTFGADRSMLGSDLPIETLRSSFVELYRAYDDIFYGRSEDERTRLLGATALDWLAARSTAPEPRSDP